MDLLTLFNNNFTNVLASFSVVVFLFLVFYFENKYIKSREETIPKLFLVIIYIFSFFLLILGVVSLMFIWGFDFENYFANIQSDFLLYIEQSIGALIGTILIIIVSMLVLKLSKIFFKSIGKKPGPHQKRKRTIAKVSASIVRYFVGILTILIILALWGVNVMPALAGLGILGLVIGLGAQKFINDLIAGFFIIFEQHFDVGDKIEVSGFKGEVTDIGLKTTRIRNWKGEIRILSNGEISSLINFSRNPSIAEVEVGIAYEENIKHVSEILKSNLVSLKNEFPQILEDPQVLGVSRLDSSSVVLRVICKTENETHYAVERAMRQRVKEILNENNIEIPFPQIVLSQKE